MTQLNTKFLVNTKFLARIPVLAMIVALAALTGCSSPLEAKTPVGMVEVEDDGERYDYRATTADGLVFAARAIEHDPQGDVGFWLKAIKNSIRDNHGYALLGEKPIKTAQGLSGVELNFGHDESGNHPHLYNLVVIVTEPNIFLLEGGGTKEQMVKNATAWNTYVTAFRVK